MSDNLPDEVSEQAYDEALTRLRDAYYTEGLTGIQALPEDVKTVVVFEAESIEATLLLAPAELTYDQQCRYVFNDFDRIIRGRKQ